MKKFLAAGLVATLTGCASVPPGGSPAQADFDQACKYANGVLAAAKPVLPLAQGLILAKFGEDASLGFASALATVQTTCAAPLDLANAGAIVQRVYDAGGKVVELIVRSQAGAG